MLSFLMCIRSRVGQGRATCACMVPTLHSPARSGLCVLVLMSLSRCSAPCDVVDPARRTKRSLGRLQCSQMERHRCLCWLSSAGTVCAAQHITKGIGFRRRWYSPRFRVPSSFHYSLKAGAHRWFGLRPGYGFPSNLHPMIAKKLRKQQKRDKQKARMCEIIGD